MSSGPAQDFLSEGCFVRADLGRFVVFVASFIPSGTRFHHAHDDLLSYSVYLDGEELLCDSGMPSYLPADRVFAQASHHNGLRAPGDFAPRPGLFVPTAMASARANLQRTADSLELHVRPAVGAARSIRLSLVANGVLEITEQASGGHCQFHLCLADATSKVREGVLESGSARLEFTGLTGLSLEDGERARDYGERLPCRRLRAAAASRVTTRIRHV